MLDIGKFLTPDDRSKEFAGIAGGIVGSLAGQSLLVPIMVDMAVNIKSLQYYSFPVERLQ